MFFSLFLDRERYEKYEEKNNSQTLKCRHYFNSRFFSFGLVPTIAKPVLIKNHFGFLFPINRIAEITATMEKKLLALPQI